MDEKKPPKPAPAVPPTESDREPSLSARAFDMRLERLDRGFQTCGPHPIGADCRSRDDCIFQEQLDREMRERAQLRDR